MVAGGLHAARHDDVRDLFDQGLADVAPEGVPRVPAQRRCRRNRLSARCSGAAAGAGRAAASSAATARPADRPAGTADPTASRRPRASSTRATAASRDASHSSRRPGGAAPDAGRSRRSSSARPRAANAGAALGSAAATTRTACSAHRAGRPRPTAESRVATPRGAAATGLGSAGAARAAVSAGPRPATAVVAVGLRRRAGRGQCGGANKRSDQPSRFLHLIDPSRQRSCPRLTAATRHEGIDAGRTNSKGVFGIGDEDPQPSRKKERLSL